MDTRSSLPLLPKQVGRSYFKGVAVFELCRSSFGEVWTCERGLAMPLIHTPYTMIGKSIPDMEIDQEDLIIKSSSDTQLGVKAIDHYIIFMSLYVH